LNVVLAERLASLDALFSRGVADEGYVCIRVGKRDERRERGNSHSPTGVDSKPLNEQAAIQYAELIKKTIDSMEADRKIVETMGLSLLAFSLAASLPSLC